VQIAERSGGLWVTNDSNADACGNSHGVRLLNRMHSALRPWRAVQPAAVKGQQITPVAAQPSVSAEDRAACLDGPFDDKVAVCTRLIESGQI
jgi:hypothetical protein